MHKPAKYFLASVIVFIGSLTLLLIYYGRPVPEIPVAVNQKSTLPAVDPQKLEEDYRVKTKAIVASVTSAVEAPTAEGNSLAGKARTELLGLTVPSKFRKLHLDLVLASDKLLSFFRNGEQTEKLASLDILKQVKNEYDWLN